MLRRPSRLDESALEGVKLFLVNLCETIRRDCKLRDLLRGLIMYFLQPQGHRLGAPRGVNFILKRGAREYLLAGEPMTFGVCVTQSAFDSAILAFGDG